MLHPASMRYAKAKMINMRYENRRYGNTRTSSVKSEVSEIVAVNGVDSKNVEMLNILFEPHGLLSIASVRNFWLLNPDLLLFLQSILIN